ncbi:hypothetical protein LCGC14_2236590 [marine sediment metagenome]|uniref:Uncharacterized protein n=1 Tax=marine sediment metagenome TaxID=412755 RepID=A0A0F9FJA4_9ZZZZ
MSKIEQTLPMYAAEATMSIDYVDVETRVMIADFVVLARDMYTFLNDLNAARASKCYMCQICKSVNYEGTHKPDCILIRLREVLP